MLGSCGRLMRRQLFQSSRALRAAAFGGAGGLSAQAPMAMWGLRRALSVNSQEEAKKEYAGEVKEYMGMRGGTIMNISERGRLDVLLARHRPSLPFSFIQRLIRNNKIKVLDEAGEWQRIKDPGSILTHGKTLHVHSKTFEECKDEPAVKETTRLVLSDREQRDLVGSVLLEHPDLIMLNKPNGLAVQGGSLMGRHLDRMTHALVPEGQEPPLLVHRLDRQTSGVIALGKSQEAAARIAEAFRGDEGMATKTYYALVSPAPKAAFGCIDHSLEKVLGKNGEPDKVRLVERDGKRAVTDYQVVSRSPDGGALLRMRPRTGRTHQLRVHCAEALRCGIVGDYKYATGHRKVREKLGTSYNKLCLHAHTLKLTFLKGKGQGGEQTVEATAPIPEHMWVAMERMGVPVPQNLKQEREKSRGFRLAPGAKRDLLST